MTDPHIPEQHECLLLTRAEAAVQTAGGTVHALVSDVACRIGRTSPGLVGTVSVLPVEPTTREAFAADAAFERSRYERYVPLLAGRLRAIHGSTHEDLFWERTLGFTLLIHVSQCRRVFRAGSLLAQSGRSIAVQGEVPTGLPRHPREERDYRQLFQYSPCGEEHLIACYRHLFGGGASVTLSPQAGAVLAGHRQGAGALGTMARLRAVVTRIWNNWRLIFGEVLVRAVRRLSSPTFLATHVYWAPEARHRLQLQTLGRLRVEMLTLDATAASRDADVRGRDLIAQPPADADDFDRFVFEALRLAAPRTWLEDFAPRLKQAERLLARYPRMRYFANESLDEDSLLLMALAAMHGATIIYCEHNYLQYQYLGNVVWYILRKVDRYLTLGWSMQGCEKVQAAGSLFRWTAGRRVEPDIDILYVSGIGMVRPPVSSAGYSTSGSVNVERYVRMKGDFFDALDDATARRIHYRDYPAWRRERLCGHALDEALIRRLSGRFKHVDQIGDVSTTDLFNRSRLVITDYLATLYIQALLADVPTVVLFNRDTSHLDDAHCGFFDELIGAGVFQPDPVAAAAFVQSIVDDPGGWWRSPAVQAARAGFLKKNMGDPHTLGRILTGLARGSAAS